MARVRPLLLALALCAAQSLVANAAPAPPRDVAGDWQGSLQGMLRIAMHFVRSPDGTLRGTMDSPDQGASGLAFDSVAFSGDSLHCEMRIATARYDARLNASGDSLIGEWRQSGMTMSLALARGMTPVQRKRPQETHPPYPYDTLEVKFDNTRAKGARLAGTLTLPSGKGPFPCALLITGSGPENRDEAVFGHRPFKVIADHLTRQGIAVLRVDDRGVGASTGSNAQATSEDFALDVLAGVEFLRTQPRIDKRRIGLVGHSEGGLIAPLVATRSKDVAFIVLLAGPGVRGDSLLMLQSLAARRGAGVTEAALAREAVILRRLYAAMSVSDSAAAVREVRALVDAQLSATPESMRGGAPDPQTLVDGALETLWHPWMRWFVAHDPAPVLQKVRVPVLALNGSKDFQVTPRENLAGIEQALKAGGNRDYSVQELAGLNHLFQTCKTCTLLEYAQLEETFAPSALAILSDWIRAKAGIAK